MTASNSNSTTTSTTINTNIAADLGSLKKVTERAVEKAVRVRLNTLTKQARSISHANTNARVAEINNEAKTLRLNGATLTGGRKPKAAEVRGQIAEVRAQAAAHLNTRLNRINRVLAAQEDALWQAFYEGTL